MTKVFCDKGMTLIGRKNVAPPGEFRPIRRNTTSVDATDYTDENR
jgi:hypothetical protein